MKQHTLAGGNTMPSLGFGTWQLQGAEATAAVAAALAAGYRHIDTADRYDNHKAVAAGIKESGIPREEIFLTTKVWMNDFPGSQTEVAIKRFLSELQTEYLDLVLLHWPDRSVSYAEPLDALVSAKAAGTVKAFGVSNFTEQHIKDVLELGYEIEVNQVELHPTWKQAALVEFCQSRSIAVTAYSPLGRGDALSQPTIIEVAAAHNAEPAQVVLAWLLAKDIVSIPKSANSERIASNLASAELTLSAADIAAIDAIPDGRRLVDPEFGDFAY